jgi:hypothetical protein
MRKDVPLRDILERLGSALREQYREVERDHPLPENHTRLLTRLLIRWAKLEPTRGSGAPQSFKRR